MKPLIGIVILIVGLAVAGYGMKKEGNENLKPQASMEVKDAKDPVNYLIIFGIAISIGGTIITFLPDRKK